MQIYKVGGAVRDRLLGLPVADTDWVVVDATSEEMSRLGFKQVGKDFPVFLHPQTKEEYALARTERKTGPGYKGFAINATPQVTLEEDLMRRDLTINAIAEKTTGELIDPFGGIDDLRGRVLRHISPAFAEDPLRVLRVARFAAHFWPYGFRIASETVTLMKEIVAAGEITALVPERAWVEVERALGEACPAQFFYALRECGALAQLLPEVDKLFGVPQRADHHPEIDTGVHVMMALEQAAKLSASKIMRFAVLMHDLGKGETPAAVLPKHIAHEEKSIPLVKNVCRRLRVPNDFKDLAILVAKYHTHCHRALELRPATVLKTLIGLDALRRPDRFELFLLACEADARGRLGRETAPYPQAAILREALHAVKKVDIQPLKDAGLTGEAFIGRLAELRINAIKQAYVLVSKPA